MESLSPEDWKKPTVAPRWNVAQVAGHLLDTALRRLAFARDGWSLPGSPPGNERELIDLVNDLNSQGVAVFGRLSPQVLISLIRSAVEQLGDYFEGLDPFAPAPFGVSWAGDRQSPNWFDIAREFTERWHHQQQIRLATNRPGIMTRALYFPVLDCFMRALPHAYRDVPAATGSVVDVTVAGECGGTWSIQRQREGWLLDRTFDGAPVLSRTVIPQEIAWRVFTKGITRAEAQAQISIEGDTRIGAVVLDMRAIVG